MRVGAALAILVLLAAGTVRAEGPPIEVRVQRSTVSVGESTTLEIHVRGGAQGDPEFDLPAGLELLGSGRVQSFTFINGRSMSEIVYRYEIGANQAGRFNIGPFRARVGGQVVLAPPVTITVVAAETRVSGGSAGPAALIADVEPSRPYVGQPVILRVRLVQRAQLAEDPQYSPPATPGFWSEAASRPESYYAAEGNQRVLVTETRTRLYPLAAGDQTVGEAGARLALFEPGSDNPALWIGGQVPRREVVVQSAPVRVAVRPLPPNAPAGFDGAVGSLTANWSVDRAHTTRDVPVAVRLEIRGIGNLPLIHSPTLESDDFEIFAAAADDSLGAPGQAAAGRRAFQWTLLPRREGKLGIPRPAFAFFDPGAGVYRTVDLPPLEIEVQAPLGGDNGSSSTFPQVFAEHPVVPMARHPQPWAFALAGGMLGAAVALFRTSLKPAKDAPERARQRERLRAIGLASGPDFWRAADDAAQWLEAQGRPVRALRDTIAAARYGGSAPDAAKLRRTLIEQLSMLLPPARPPLPLRVAAAVLTLAAAALIALFSGGVPDLSAGRARAMTAADQAARSGDMARARAAWLALWKEGARDGGLAARLSWAEIRSGSVAPAAAWVLAGEVSDPRDPALEWVRHRVQEAGGLIGSGGGRLGLRRLEWALIALALGILAGVLWPRVAWSVVLVVLCAGAAAVFPLETLAMQRADRAVVKAPITLDQSGLELETGQVVRILERAGARVRIAAGRGVTAWVKAADLYSVEDLK